MTRRRITIRAPATRTSARSALALDIADGTRSPTSSVSRPAEWSARIESLPTVLSAQVVATLPDRLRRGRSTNGADPAGTSPRTARGWSTSRRVLVRRGRPAGRRGRAPCPPSSTCAPPTAGAVGRRARRRATSRSCRLLGALTPADLVTAVPGSFGLTRRRHRGWVLDRPGRWRAVFGLYTPDLRTSDDIPRTGAVPPLAAGQTEVGRHAAVGRGCGPSPMRRTDLGSAATVPRAGTFAGPAADRRHRRRPQRRERAPLGPGAGNTCHRRRTGAPHRTQWRPDAERRARRTHGPSGAHRAPR